MAEFPPAMNGTEQRLDALINEIRRLNDLLANDVPESSGEIHLQEPVTKLNPKVSAPSGSNSSPAPVSGKKK